MANIRNPYEISLMRESGKISAKALKNALEAVKKGVRGVDVDKVAQDTIYKAGGDLSYKTVPDYKFATCITVNEQVVHGIPAERKFEDGDLVSIDLAVEYKDWHTDTAWSILVKDQSRFNRDQKRIERFLKTGEDALWLAVAQAVDGNKIGDISSAIQQRVERAGYSVVRSLVGHGVGRHLHEDPQIPGYGIAGTGMVLKSGMTLAIEVIYTQGLPDVVLGSDNWTFLTADGSLAGLFEMTVIVGKNKAEVLTDWRKA